MRKTPELGKQFAMPMTVPSPLVGEGITAGRPELSRVRGADSNLAVRQPLTRLRSAKPPSPTRGEGKKPATHLSRTA